NALRLRTFRPASSAAEILHPTLKARVAEWGYLAGIGALAIAIGLLALRLMPGSVMTDIRAAGYAMPIDAARMALPDRTVDVRIGGAGGVNPEAVSVDAGHAVAFVVHNDGAVPLRFSVGWPDATSGATVPHEMMGQSNLPRRVTVDPAETATIVVPFTADGVVPLSAAPATSHHLP